jgi:hypothetical protein
MIVPEMPKGYNLMQDTGFWYILKDTGVYMKRLLDKDGDEKRFHPTSRSLAEAAEYARKHKELTLNYDQEVPEEEKG